MLNIVFLLLRRLQGPLITLILTYAIAVLGFVLIPSTDGQGHPAPMSFFHAFYIVSYTATTIGFGELPNLFTDAQRMWITFVIYLTVIAWMYSIGTILALVQEQSFKETVRALTFRRSVSRIVEPFYLVCGYGDTGRALVQGLTQTGRRAVVIDQNADRINALALEDLDIKVPGLTADAGKPDTLMLAGLQSPYCAGVLALTQSDLVNMQISISAKLLRPELLIVSRAQTSDSAANLAALGIDYIVNPFNLFSRILSHALHSPSLYALDETLTSVPHEHCSAPVDPPRGKWIVCGFGRFGQALFEALSGEGITCTIVEADPALAACAPGSVIGRGTEAEVLLKAGIGEASGIIAGTDNDTYNLSIIITARRLNPTLFVIARQNHRDNNATFEAAHPQLVLQNGRILAGEVYAAITSPLVVDFLRLAEQEDELWARTLHTRIRAIAGEFNPASWVIDVCEKTTPTVIDQMKNGARVTLADLQRDPLTREICTSSIALLRKRGRDYQLLPNTTDALEHGDLILFCGDRTAARHMHWLTHNHNIFRYVYTGEEVQSRLMSLLVRGKQRKETRTE